MNYFIPFFAAALTAISNAAILVQDNFNSLGAANLAGSVPSTNATGITNLAWQASTTVSTPMKGDGSQGLAVFTTTQTAGIDLGQGYFVSNPGIYRLSVDMTYPSTATSECWIGIGFSQGLTMGENLTHSSNNGSPWAFLRANGSLNGRDLANSGRVVASGLASGTTRRISVELNTTTTQWTYRILVDGTQVGSTITYAANANPEGIQYLALSSGVNGTAFTGTLDNFTFEAIPEPGATVLAGAATCLGLLRRRRQP